MVRMSHFSPFLHFKEPQNGVKNMLHALTHKTNAFISSSNNFPWTNNVKRSKSFDVVCHAFVVILGAYKFEMAVSC